MPYPSVKNSGVVGMSAIKAVLTDVVLPLGTLAGKPGAKRYVRGQSIAR